jgi:ADP-ribosyl-[dinitrogen reductase] hydrolase
MLLELTIGDAYGAGFEYADKKIIEQHNNLKGYIQHPRHLGTKPGMYTDDAQMSLAIAEMMIEKLDWTELNLANKFVEVFKRDEREGYAGGFYHFLQAIKDGTEFLEKIKPTSDKSGAAMRASVIGLFKDKNEVLEKTTIQAAVTHNTRDGINAAQAAAMMVYFFKHEKGRQQDLAKYLKANVKGDWASRWTGKVRSKGWMSVRAAITAVMDASSMSELLKICVDYTGDVDTVATIALAAASQSKEIIQDIPSVLILDLEDGEYGRTYIEGLDKKLLLIGK